MAHHVKKAFYAAVPNFYDDLKFSFKVTSLQERFEESSRIRKPAELANAMANFVAKRLVEWDLKDANGAPVPITAAALLDPSKCDPSLLSRLHGTILGIDGWDTPPDEPASEPAEPEFEALTVAESMARVSPPKP